MGFTRFIRFAALLSSTWAIVSVQADTVVRGPYLQLPTPDSITIRWRTDTSHAGTVFFGASSTNLNQSETESAGTTEHEVVLTGLQPATAYYYAVGYGTNVLAGNSSYRFRTFPVAGAPDHFRAWVMGDPGTATADSMSVYTSYQTYTGTNGTDLILTLGDNAYPKGTDIEFQNRFFDEYPEILRTTVVFPGFGNHEGYTSTSSTQTGPYFDIFSLPTNGVCGGTPSGTEAYYSFDYGNTHFICLDSYGSDRTTNGAMYAWLEQDLMACTSIWIVAYWHHAPYTMGGHNSDSESWSTGMRENFNPLLEAYGTDLVLGGHSHNYERTYLLDGHYGSSASFDLDVHVLNYGDGQESGDGVYVKPSTVKTPHAGTVYVVAGSSGQVVSSLIGDHPAMETALLEMGSVVLDIVSNRLDLVFLNKDGVIRDSFSILKGKGDYDSDGMSDLWEQDTFRISIAPDDNYDNDVQDNLSEYIAGTDLTDPASYFYITTNTTKEAGFVIQWDSVSNRSYNVIWSSALSNAMVNIQTNILYPVNAYTDMLHSVEDAGFYRVGVSLQE